MECSSYEWKASIICLHAFLYIYITQPYLQYTGRYYQYVERFAICLYAVYHQTFSTLQWRHYGCYGVSNQQRLDCLLNRRSKKKIKAPLHWPLWREFTGQRVKGPVTRKRFPLNDVIMVTYDNPTYRNLHNSRLSHLLSLYTINHCLKIMSHVLRRCPAYILKCIEATLTGGIRSSLTRVQTMLSLMLLPRCGQVWPSDAIWRRLSLQIPVKVMVHCLTKLFGPN